MTPSNNPNEAGEAQNTKKKENPSILYGLTQNSINKYIRSSQTNQVNALSYLDGNPTKIDSIRKELLNTIQSQRSSFPKESDEANIAETDINEYLSDTSRMRRMILDETITRRSLEKNVWDTLQSRYTKNSLKASQVNIMNAVQRLNDFDLKQVLLKRDFGHRNLIEGIVNPAPVWRDLDELTRDLGISSQALVDDPTLSASLQHYLQTGHMGTADIEELIQSQVNFSIDGKRKILAFFVPTVTIHMLEGMGISTSDKQKKAEEIVTTLLKEQGKINPGQSIYDILPTEDLKDEIRTWIQYVEGLTIPTSDLSDASIELFFDKKSSILADAMADHMDSLGQQEQLRTMSSLSQFKSRIKKELVDQNGNCLISKIDTLTKSSYIISDLGGVEEKAWKVLSYDINIGGSGTSAPRGFSLEGYHSNGSTLGMASGTEYDILFDLFRNKLKSGSIVISADKPAYISSNESSCPFTNFDGFMEWINVIDPSNKSKKIENGMSFAVTIDGQQEIYRIETLDANKNSFSLRDKYNHTYSNLRFTLEGFYERLKGDSGNLGFHRLGDVSTLEKFAASTSIDGVIYDHNELLLDDSHGHDEHHDDHGHAKKPIWGFQNDSGNVIETQFEGDLVTILEWIPYHESKNKKNDKTGKDERKVDKKFKRTEHPKMTLEGLQAFLEEHKFNKAVTENPHSKQVEDIHDEVHPHFHGRSPLSLFMGMKNFADIGKAFTMGSHMVTHMLEEQSKMHAAEAMYGFFAKTLGKDHALTMHALMEFSGDIGKAIDDKVAYLKRLSGLPRRKEIRHILLTRPAKPHDILAALIVTADMAGHLYPDSEIQDLQGGQYVWFDSVCLALGFDPKTELKKAQSKEENKNAETSDHMHETVLLTRFFKLNQDKSPYIQAIAGGSKFWNAVSSGRSAQAEKGKKEGGEYLGAMDRAEYVVSKMESNEPEIAMGAYPTVYGKDPSAVNLGPAFVWALSNFPNTAHPETSNTFKNMMDGNGVAFHALPFCRNKANSNTYKATMDTLIHSLAHKDPGKYGSMSDAWNKTKTYKKPAGEYTFQEDHVRELWLFWKNYNNLLHPILQLTDPYIFTLLEDEHTAPHDKSILRSYVEKLGTTVKEGRLNDTGPDENIMKMGGYRFDGGSMIVDIDKDGQKSINRHLNYIHIGQNGDIQNVHQREQIWNGQIIPYIKSMRKNENFIDNPELQEAQFIKIHDEIMHFLRQKIVDRYFSGAEKQDYIRQLSDLGFNMSKENLYQKELPGKLVNFGGKESFQKFITGKRTLSEGVQDKSHKFATELLGTAAVA